MATLSIILITLDKRLPDTVTSLRSLLSSALYPVQVIANLPVDIYHITSHTFRHPESSIQDNAEIRTLNAKILSLQVQLQRMVALETENQRLRELLSSSSRVNGKSILAEILSIDIDPYARKVLVNKGSLHQIKPGQPMLDAFGIMGQVIHVGKFSSTVILLTDPNHAIPVQVNRNGLRTIAQGTGQPNRLKINFVPSNADIKKGDLLVSSGLGGRFPQGYPVAIIRSIHIDPTQPYLSVSAEPTAHILSSREVVIIQNEPELHDIQNLLENLD